MKKNTCAERAYVKLSWLRFVHVDNPFFALRFFFFILSVLFLLVLVRLDAAATAAVDDADGW